MLWWFSAVAADLFFGGAKITDWRRRSGVSTCCGREVLGVAMGSICCCRSDVDVVVSCCCSRSVLAGTKLIVLMRAVMVFDVDCTCSCDDTLR